MLASLIRKSALRSRTRAPAASSGLANSAASPFGSARKTTLASRAICFASESADSDAKQIARDASVVFLALPNGLAAEFAKPLLAAGARVLDLSADFRIKDASIYQEFYGHEHPAPDLLG